MRLKRDLISEKYEQLKGVYDKRIPNGYYEIIIHGKTKQEDWKISSYIPKCKNTNNYVEELLNLDRTCENLQEWYDRFTLEYEMNWFPEESFNIQVDITYNDNGKHYSVLKNL